jgi:hypothetical protein
VERLYDWKGKGVYRSGFGIRPLAKIIGTDSWAYPTKLTKYLWSRHPTCHNSKVARS